MHSCVSTLSSCQDDNGIDSDMEEDETDAGSSEDEDSPLDANVCKYCT